MKKLLALLLLGILLGCSKGEEVKKDPKNEEFNELITYQIMVGAYRDSDGEFAVLKTFEENQNYICVECRYRG